MGTLKLHEVHSIRATVEPGVFHIMCKITDYEGMTYDALHVLRPDDPHGLSPDIRQWMVDNPSFPIEPYVPPTIEEIRGNAPRIDRLAFRTGIKAQGITTTKINEYLAQIADPDLADDMAIFWESAQHFGRLDPFVVNLGEYAGTTEAQLDTVFNVVPATN